MSDYPKISQESYDKAKGQFKMAVGEVLSVFNIYGMHIYLGGAIEEIVELAEQFGKRVRNHDTPIQLKKRRNPRDK